jgi:FimV-like protein
MIYLILKSYLSLILSVAATALVVLMAGLCLIFRSIREKNDLHQPAIINIQNDSEPLTAMPDVSAIAGNDLMETQLDLARAYIETGKVNVAKKILKQVMTQGNASERQEAEQLLGVI